MLLAPGVDCGIALVVEEKAMGYPLGTARPQPGVYLRWGHSPRRD